MEVSSFTAPDGTPTHCVPQGLWDFSENDRKAYRDRLLMAVQAGEAGGWHFITEVQVPVTQLLGPRGALQVCVGDSWSAPSPLWQLLPHQRHLVPVASEPHPHSRPGEQPLSSPQHTTCALQTRAPRLRQGPRGANPFQTGVLSLARSPPSSLWGVPSLERGRVCSARPLPFLGGPRGRDWKT